MLYQLSYTRLKWPRSWFAEVHSASHGKIAPDEKRPSFRRDAMCLEVYRSRLAFGNPLSRNFRSRNFRRNVPPRSSAGPYNDTLATVPVRTIVAPTVITAAKSTQETASPPLVFLSQLAQAETVPPFHAPWPVPPSFCPAA